MRLATGVTGASPGRRRRSPSTGFRPPALGLGWAGLAQVLGQFSCSDPRSDTPRSRAYLTEPSRLEQATGVLVPTPSSRSRPTCDLASRGSTSRVDDIPNTASNTESEGVG